MFLKTCHVRDSALQLLMCRLTLESRNFLKLQSKNQNESHKSTRFTRVTVRFSIHVMNECINGTHHYASVLTSADARNSYEQLRYLHSFSIWFQDERGEGNRSIYGRYEK
jgi:hypothetical protein